MASLLNRDLILRAASSRPSPGAPRAEPRAAFSRRSFLGLTASTGLAALPLQANARATDRLRFQETATAITVVGSRSRSWRLDKAHLGPDTTCKLERLSARSYVIALDAAGTIQDRLPLQIRLCFTKQDGGWYLSAHCFGSNDLRAIPAREWLDGEAAIPLDPKFFRGLVLGNDIAAATFTSSKLSVALDRDLVAHLRARGVCRISTPGGHSYRGDHARLRLLAPEEPLIAAAGTGQPAQSPVLRLDLTSRRDRWPSTPLLGPLPQPFELSSRSIRPTQVSLELNSEAIPTIVTELRGPSEGSLRIHGPLRGRDGAPAILSVGEISLVQAVRASTVEHLMRASLGSSAGYLFQTEAFQAEVTGGPQAYIQIVVSKAGDSILRTYIATSDCDVAVPVSDSYTYVVATPAGTNLRIAPDGQPGSCKVIENSDGSTTLECVEDCSVFVTEHHARLDLSKVRLTVLRSLDFMALEFTFRNLALEVHAGGSFLTRLNAQAPTVQGTVQPNPPPPSVILVGFPPQTLREASTYEETGDETVPAPFDPKNPQHALLSNPTRLAFEIPGPLLERKPEFSLKTLLGWEQLILRVDPRAQSKVPVGFNASPTPLADDVTSIDFFGLFFSPNERALWRHNAKPMQIGKRWQLYSGLLFDGPGGGDSVGLRALYSDDYGAPNNTPQPPCKLLGDASSDGTIFSLGQNDRASLVQLMSDYSLVDPARGANYVPLPVFLDYLCLSALGGSMKADGAFIAPVLDSDDGIDIETWSHESAYMRLNVDEIKYRYFCFPHGFRIALVKKTARVVYKSTNPLEPEQNIACLRTQVFIEWVEREIDYTQRPLPHDVNSQHPFRKLRLNETARRSPPIENPCKKENGVTGLQDPSDAFWPMVNGAPLPLHLQGIDVGGEPGRGDGTSQFPMPFIAVRGTYALRFTGTGSSPTDDDIKLQTVKKYYRTDATAAARRSVMIGGQYIHYSKTEKPGDSEFKTHQILFDYDDVPYGTASGLPQLLRSHYWPRFVPATAEVVANIPAIEHLTGASRVSFAYAKPYLQYGLRDSTGQIPSNNKGEVTLELLGEAPPAAVMNREAQGIHRWYKLSGGASKGVDMQFPGSGTAGVLAPSFVMTAFSPTNGPVGGDLKQFATGVLNFGDFFQKTNSVFPKLMGAIDLAAVLLPEIADLQQALEQIPNLANQALSELTADLLAPLQAVQAALAAAQARLTALTDALQAQIGQTLHTVEAALIGKLIAVGDQIVAALFRGKSPYLPAIPPVAQTWCTLKAKLQGTSADCSHLSMMAAFPAATTTSCTDRCATAQSFQDVLTAVVETLQEQQGTEALLQSDVQDVIDAIAAAASASISWLADTATDIQQTLGTLSLPNPVTQLDVAQEIKDLQQIVTGFLTTLQGGGIPILTAEELKTVLDRLKGFIGLAATQLDPGKLRNLILAPFQRLQKDITANFTRGQTLYKSLVTGTQGPPPTPGITGTWDALAQRWNTLPQGKTAAIACLNTANDRLKALFPLLIQQLTQPIQEWVAMIQQSIIAAADAAVGNLGDQVAAFIDAYGGLATQALGMLNELRQPRLVKVDYSFSPTLRDGPAEAPIFVAQLNGKAATLTLTVNLTIPFDPLDPGKSRPQVTVNGDLKNFALVFIPSLEFLRIGFEEVTFVSENGGTPKVNVKIAAVTFGSALAFLSAFQDMMNIGDPANGPYLIVTGVSVLAGFGYHKDEIELGAFIVRNLGFDAHIKLSLENDPLHGVFSFASAARRFSVTYGIYGGGGYLELNATPDGIEGLSIAIEGGVYADFDCGGIASGSAHAVIGFLYSKAKDVCEFRGYFDADADVDVLGLIHAHLGFYLALCYSSGPSGSKTSGICIITVDIDFGLWTLHVDVECYREFQSSGNDRRVAPGARALAHLGQSTGPILIGPDYEPYYNLWDEYEAAFA